VHLTALKGGASGAPQAVVAVQGHQPLTARFVNTEHSRRGVGRVQDPERQGPHRPEEAVAGEHQAGGNDERAESGEGYGGGGAPDPTESPNREQAVACRDEADGAREAQSGEDRLGGHDAGDRGGQGVPGQGASEECRLGPMARLQQGQSQRQRHAGKQAYGEHRDEGQAGDPGHVCARRAARREILHAGDREEDRRARHDEQPREGHSPREDMSGVKARLEAGGRQRGPEGQAADGHQKHRREAVDTVLEHLGEQPGAKHLQGDGQRARARRQGEEIATPRQGRGVDDGPREHDSRSQPGGEGSHGAAQEHGSGQGLTRAEGGDGPEARGADAEERSQKVGAVNAHRATAGARRVLDGAHEGGEGGAHGGRRGQHGGDGQGEGKRGRPGAAEAEGLNAPCVRLADRPASGGYQQRDEADGHLE